MSYLNKRAHFGIPQGFIIAADTGFPPAFSSALLRKKWRKNIPTTGNKNVHALNRSREI